MNPSGGGAKGSLFAFLLSIDSLSLPPVTLPSMLCSAVSSHMIKALCVMEGLHWEETLTGFKWLCNRAEELRAEGYDVAFCYEEAIGFSLGDVVRDKDGVSAGAVK